jgi:hypothetical protein
MTCLCERTVAWEPVRDKCNSVVAGPTPGSVTCSSSVAVFRCTPPLRRFQTASGNATRRGRASRRGDSNLLSVGQPGSEVDRGQVGSLVKPWADASKVRRFSTKVSQPRVRGAMSRTTRSLRLNLADVVPAGRPSRPLAAFARSRAPAPTIRCPRRRALHRSRRGAAPQLRRAVREGRKSPAALPFSSTLLSMEGPARRRGGGVSRLASTVCRLGVRAPAILTWRDLDPVQHPYSTGFRF